MRQVAAEHPDQEMLLVLVGKAEIEGTFAAVMAAIEKASVSYPLPVYAELHRALILWLDEAATKWGVSRKILDRIRTLEEAKSMIGAAAERAMVRLKAEIGAGPNALEIR